MTPTSTTPRTPAESPFERDLRRLLTEVAEHDAVDVDALRTRMGDLDRPASRPARAAAWVAVAAASVVAVAAAGAATGWFGRAAAPVPAGPTAPPSHPVATSPTGWATLGTPTAGTPAARTTSAAPSAVGPVLMPGMRLPANQQEADYVPVSSDMRLEGRVLGLGTVHVKGRPFHLVLVPGRALPGHEVDGRRPDGACLVWLPATAPVNDTSTAAQQWMACSFLPATNATGPRAFGGASLLDPSTNEIDELRGVVAPLVMTSSSVAAVDVVQEKRSLRLPHRLTLPGVDGAVFLGFGSYLPETRVSQASIVGRDAKGAEVFRF